MLRILFLLAFTIVSFSGFSEDKKEEPKSAKKESLNDDLIITSKHLNYDHVNRQAIFTRDVKAVNGDTIMTSEKMICYFDEKNDPYLVVAEGNVVIVRGDKTAKSQKAVYKVNEEIIILRKQPQLFDGTNTIKARIITFYEAKNISEFDDPDCVFYKSATEDTKDTKGDKKPEKTEKKQ